MNARLLPSMGVLFLLCGCNSGATITGPSTAPAPIPAPSAPAPAPAPMPVAAMPPRRGKQVFAADWSQPSIGLGLALTQDTPPAYTGAATTYATFDRPGTQGDACVDPGPNAGYSTQNGTLVMHAVPTGYPIATRQLFSKDSYISCQAEISYDLAQPDAFCGVAFYNGENNYGAVYYAGDGALGYWTTTHRIDFPQKYPPNEMHKVRIDYEAGVRAIYVDDVLMATDSVAAPLGLDDPTFLNDPCFSFWAGDVQLTVGAADVWVE